MFILIMGSIQIDPSVNLTFNGYLINQETLLGIRSKTILAGILLLGSISMFMLPAARKAIGRFISWFPHMLFFMPVHFRQLMSKRFHLRSQAILDNLALGFEVLKNPYKIITCLLLSVGVWLLTFCSYYVLALGCNGLNITYIQAAAAVIITCFFIMLPSVPGYWGIWEVGGIYGLMIFGIPKTQAAGLTLTYHFFQIIPLILVGLLSSWLIGVNIMQAGLHAEELGDKEQGM
jgi:hypothetical protein